MTPSDIVSWCQSYIGELLGMPAASIDPDGAIADLGLDSAAAVSMVLELETKLGRELDPALLFEHGTLRAVGAVLGAPEQVPLPVAASNG
jgi:acyl carrier protein